MLKIECKTILNVMGTILVPMMVQADHSISSDQIQEPPIYVQGEGLKTGALPAGYNASATYQCKNGWNVFLTGDYIYWAWEQDSLKIVELLSPTLRQGGSEKSVYLDPGYASGFQVGLGFAMPGMDHWNLYSEYTWYRNSEEKTVTNDPLFVMIREGVPFQNPSSSYYVNGTIEAEAKMNFDALDFLLKRPFYFGRKVTANFSTGLTALWITQTFEMTTRGLVGPIITSATLPYSSTNSQTQTSWGLGPKFGFESNWLIGSGLQIMANLSASMLYTRYELHATGYGSITNPRPASFSITGNDLDGYGTIRPVTEAFLGLGWNMGIYGDKSRVGLSAGYDFNVYWDYNMTQYSNKGFAGNMYLQGLNIEARFDF